MSGYLNSGLIALGTDQGHGLALLSSVKYHQIGTCIAAANGVVLPANQPAGTSLIIRNDGAYSLSIHHPLVGGFINGLPATVAATGVGAYILSPGCVIEIVLAGQNQAYTMGNIHPSTLIPIIAAYTVLPCQNGASFLVAQSAVASYTITLPASTIPALKYTFINGGASNHNVSIDCGAGNAEGNCLVAITAPIGYPVTAQRYVSFLLTASALGDTLTVQSDGLNWNVSAISKVALGMSSGNALP
jgi:hypothetical protein